MGVHAVCVNRLLKHTVNNTAVLRLPHPYHTTVILTKQTKPAVRMLM